MQDWWRPRRYTSGVMRVPPDVPLAFMDITIGSLLIIGGQQRSSSNAFAQAKQLTSIEHWGVAFILVGLALVLAILHPERQSFVSFTRIVGPALCVMWAVLYLLSGLSNPRVAFIGVPPYLYLAYRHHFAPTRPVG